MKPPVVFTVITAIFLVAGCAALRKTAVGPDRGEHWHALHILSYNNDEALERFGKNIPGLAKIGLNVLILEVDYNYEFQSHPELRSSGRVITKEGARKFAALCREYDIRLIPQFQCLGHQSWAKNTFPLLTKYPHFDLTPGAFPGNEGVYCREWDVTNPAVYAMVFDLLDEIIDGFQADAIHVGMDEVFLLGSDLSPSTKGKDPAVLFAKAVNDLYGHLVKKRRVEMIMWADRLIDGEKYKFGKWESSVNGTAPALDMIPKDIILSPWHYEPRDSYPSIPVFLEKGFRVIPASWQKEDASRMLIEYSLAQKNRNMLGHTFTTWGKAPEDITTYPPLAKGLPLLRGKR
jgi:hypothetical protein